MYKMIHLGLIRFHIHYGMGAPKPHFWKMRGYSVGIKTKKNFIVVDFLPGFPGSESYFK